MKRGKELSDMFFVVAHLLKCIIQLRFPRDISKFVMKMDICGTNTKSSIDKNINQIHFVFIRNNAGKISIQTSKCRFAIQLVLVCYL